MNFNTVDSKYRAERTSFLRPNAHCRDSLSMENKRLVPKCLLFKVSTIQWNFLIRTLSGPAVLSFVERLSSFRGDFYFIFK